MILSKLKLINKLFAANISSKIYFLYILLSYDAAYF